MPPKDNIDPVDAPKVKKTPAERQAARAARQAARPLKKHPRDGKPKPKAKDGGKLRPNAKRSERVEAKRVDGAIVFSQLVAEDGVSEWIVLEESTEA